MKHIAYLFLIMLLLSCNKDKEDVYNNLTIETNVVSIYEMDIVKVVIRSGSDFYKIINHNETIAKAYIKNDIIYIEGLKEGKIVITILDEKSKQTSTITVVVKNKYDAKILIKAGTFTMGSPDGEGLEDERPQHIVTITKDYYLGKYEVTNRQFAKFLNEQGNREELGIKWYKGKFIRKVKGIYKVKKGKENYPVQFVNWYGAKAYCKWVGGRLPTEAEWEYAAKSGSQTNIYSGGNTIDYLAWYDSNSNGEAHEVGLKKPNKFGIYDMTGNVYEWCIDGYYDYNEEEQINPIGNENSTTRIVRGGSWFNFPLACRVVNRYDYPPLNREFDVGFRVVFSEH